jgi:hypothetical protein
MHPFAALLAAEAAFAHDLHVLSTPPAFILSQDQTLQFELGYYPSLLRTRAVKNLFCFANLRLRGKSPKLTLVVSLLFSFQRTDSTLCRDRELYSSLRPLSRPRRRFISTAWRRQFRYLKDSRIQSALRCRRVASAFRPAGLRNLAPAAKLVKPHFAVARHLPFR